MVDLNHPDPFEDAKYEQGYQDGQMDAENDLIQSFKGSTDLSVTVETRLGHNLARITLTTTSDTYLYDILTRLWKENHNTPKPTYQESLQDALDRIANIGL